MQIDDALGVKMREINLLKMRSQLLMTCFVLVNSMGVSAQTILTYPNIDGLAKKGIGYQVLKLALEKSGGAYLVRVDRPAINQERAVAMLAAGQIDVMDTGVDKGLANRFDLIYRPMDRGLLGWRVFIIRKDEEHEFAQIRDISNLKKYVAGQGLNWPDGEILKAAGINVQFAPQVKNLISMVEKKRFDFLPLGVGEAYGFLRLYGGEGLIVERTLVLVYPFGNFFYIRKGNIELKYAIEKGMDVALKDGSLQKLLETNEMFRDAFGLVRIKERRVIKIDNKNLPDGFERIDSVWWYKSRH